MLYTINEICDLMGICRKTFYNMLKDGRLEVKAKYGTRYELGDKETATLEKIKASRATTAGKYDADDIIAHRSRLIKAGGNV